MQNAISVYFNQQTITAFLKGNEPFVAMKPICENMGLDWDAQRQRIKRHPVLSSTTVMITAVAEDGKQREMLCLPIKLLNGWLFGIDANRVKPELKASVIVYQQKCFDVLADYFSIALHTPTEDSKTAIVIERMLTNLVPNQVKEVLDMVVKFNDQNLQIVAVQLAKKFA